MKRIFLNMPAWARFILKPIAGAAFLALISFVVMKLWNNLLPDIIHVNTVTFWQAGGIFILCKILFGFGNHRGRFGGDRSLLKRKLAERMKDMNPEERARFKTHFKENKFDYCRKFNQEEEREDD